MRRSALWSLCRWRPRVAGTATTALSLSIWQMGDRVREPGLCQMDLEHTLGIVGIVATLLNLLVVVFVYIFTPVWPANTQSGDGLAKKAMRTSAVGKWTTYTSVWEQQEAVVGPHLF